MAVSSPKLTIKLSGNTDYARLLVPFSMKQRKIMHGLMGFQQLEQSQRTLKLNDGSIIKCSTVFGVDQIEIYSPPFGGEEEFYCFCSCLLSSGTVTAVYSEYDTVECDDDTQEYPDCCNATHADIEFYNGIRYGVNVCQNNGFLPFICVPSDFVRYEVDDQVAVLFMGRWTTVAPKERETPYCWEPTTSSTDVSACSAVYRSGGDEEADGSFVVVPITFPGVDSGL